MSDNGREAPADPAVVGARLAALVAATGDRLTVEQREQVRSRIERTVKLGAAMRAFALGNADEPEIVFAPYRGEQ